jgi:ferredoxin, 2Fe-2S
VEPHGRTVATKGLGGDPKKSSKAIAKHELYCIYGWFELTGHLAMPKITFIEHDGIVHTVEAEVGSTVMETALRNDVASIVAECGGSCTCATCLVHVDEGWSGIVGPPSAEEEAMLDSAFELKPTSRLSCQIKVSDELDGLVVHTPAYQGR